MSSDIWYVIYVALPLFLAATNKYLLYPDQYACSECHRQNLKEFGRTKHEQRQPRPTTFCP
ncbi:hypothetical protein BDZ97DRAFT_1844683 [Flammula alnicola]|nr:hypothetical protein BDZ97DRAFT_1844683 [Flammula alnicola]